MELKRCVLWTAVSSEEQARKSSPEVQRAANQRFVVETMPAMYGTRGEILHELELADTRSIIELSEAAAAYPDSYGILYDLLRRRERAFDILVCRSADRLGRTRTLISSIEELCEARGIVIVYVAEALPPTLTPHRQEGASYTAANRGAAAREEILRLVTRRDTGMRETRLKEKKLFPGIPPFGYGYQTKLTDEGPVKEIVVIPDEAATVRRLLIDLYLGEGLGTQAIAERLNAEGRKGSRGGAWNHGMVGVILRRVERYAGWLEFNKRAQPGREYVKVRGDYPQIITAEELARLLADRDDRAKAPIRRRYALSGVVLCTSCGKALTYHSYDRDGEPVQTLRCNRSYCLERVEVRLPIVVDAITEFIEYIAALPATDLAAFLRKQTADPAVIDRQIAQAEAERKRLDETRRRVVRAYTELQALEEEEFVTRLRQTDERLATNAAGLAGLRAQRQQLVLTEQRVVRAEEVAGEGRKVLGWLVAEPERANVWLRQHLRVWIKPGSRYEERVERVELV